MIDFDRLSIAIVTWNRSKQLVSTVCAWAETAPTYREMLVIANHPADAVIVLPVPRVHLVPTGRPPEHHGCLAKSWNLAMLWAFRDPEVEWLLCSMDDVEIKPGWPGVLDKYPADLYLAPAGDLVFLFNRRVLREVGWFDERFSVIGFQEWDWQARAVKALGRDRVCIQDAHGWQHNPIDLAEYWQHIGQGRERVRNGTFEHLNAGWLVQKWGQRDVFGVKNMLCSGQIGEPLVSEIEWYPWFNRGTL